MKYCLEGGTKLDLGQMVKRAKEGDKEALLALIMNKKDEYFRLAYTFTENREDAMDALEDMIVILYREIARLKKDEVFYSWSKTILVNCCRGILRKRKKTVVLDEIEGEACEGGFERHDRRIDIMKYLKGLNEHQQEAIKLKYLMDLDYETIAKVVNVPVGTVKSRISTGLKKLKQCFGGEY